MTRSEILGLSFLLEQDQLEVLDNFGIVQHKPYGEGDVITCTHPESLPDLADRLFKEAKEDGPDLLFETLKTSKIWESTGIEYELSDYEIMIWWVMDSKPIHRIQAALLAKEEV